MMCSPKPTSAYIHVPFCEHRCGYCNFTVVASNSHLVEPYLLALEKELSWLGEPPTVHTFFLGGGTPTELDSRDLERLLDLVRSRFCLGEISEFTVEANPNDLAQEKVQILSNAGVNRVSIGAQSFHSRKLKTLERRHRGDDIRRAVDIVRTVISNVSLDLIFAIPGESLEQWQNDLDEALALQPSHISTYGLTFERGTRFWSRRSKGTLLETDEELQRQMYAGSIDRIVSAGFEHYEVSNFARPGFRCAHNEVYWLGGSYYAAGPGAARYVDGWRETNHKSTWTWMKRLQANESPVSFRERLSPEDRARERFVFGMRRLEGIDRDEFANETGFDVTDMFGDALERHLRQRAIVAEGRRLRLSSEGLFVSDAIWPDFLVA